MPLLVALSSMASACRLLGAGLPCSEDTHCPFGQACVTDACIVQNGGDSPRDDADAGNPGRDAGPDDGGPDDGGPDDAGPNDGGPNDGGPNDSGPVDAGDPPTWWDDGWRSRVILSFDNSAQSDALNDFPVLVPLNAADVDVSLMNANGSDLRFVDADNVTELSYEIEQWIPGGTSLVWVRVPRIEAASDQDFIHLYFENPDAIAAQDANATWEPAYRGVWHLDGDPAAGAGNQKDVSGNGKHGSALAMSSADSVAGVISRALAFDGGHVVRIDNSATGGALDIVGPLTLSAWIFPESTGGTVLAKREGGVSQWQLELEVFSGSEPQLALITSDASDSQCIWATQAGLPLGEWHHVAVTVGADSEPEAFFIDGAPVAFDVMTACAGPSVSRAFDVAIGARWAGVPNPGFAFVGLIDEARVESVARPSSWMAAQVLSMTQGFVSFGVTEPHP